MLLIKRSLYIVSSPFLSFINVFFEEILSKILVHQEKDFELSDKIRDELLEKGIILEDKESGTTWKKS